MRRRHLRRQFAGIKAVVRERWGVGVARPELTGHHDAQHLGRADAEHVSGEGAAGGRVAVGAHSKQAGLEMAALGQHDVADALRVVKAIDTDFAHPVARDAQDLAAVVVVFGQVMVGDHDYLRGIPDFRAQPLEHRLQAARAARVVHHRQVDLASHDLARPDPRAASGAGDELLGESLLHPCSRDSFSALSGGFTKLDRRLTAAMPAVSRSLIAISADLAMRVMPFTIGAPSMLAPRSAPNSIIGRPPAGTITSAPASSRMRHSRSHFGASLAFAASLAKESMKSATVACTARTPTTRLWMP